MFGSREEKLFRLGVAGVLYLKEEQRRALTSHHDVLLADLASGYDVDHGAGSKQLSVGCTARLRRSQRAPTPA